MLETAQNKDKRKGDLSFKMLLNVTYRPTTVSVQRDLFQVKGVKRSRKANEKKGRGRKNDPDCIILD